MINPPLPYPQEDSFFCYKAYVYLSCWGGGTARVETDGERVTRWARLILATYQKDVREFTNTICTTLPIRLNTNLDDLR